MHKYTGEPPPAHRQDSTLGNHGRRIAPHVDAAVIIRAKQSGSLKVPFETMRGGDRASDGPGDKGPGRSTRPRKLKHSVSRRGVEVIG